MEINEEALTGESVDAEGIVTTKEQVALKRAKASASTVETSQPKRRHLVTKFSETVCQSKCLAEILQEI